MSYTAIILPEGEKEIKVLFNAEPKPIRGEIRHKHKYQLMKWRKNHRYFDFKSKDEWHAVIGYSGIYMKKYLKGLSKGVEFNCIEIRKGFAYFSAPKEETVSEERPNPYHLYNFYEYLKKRGCLYSDGIPEETMSAHVGEYINSLTNKP